MNNRKFHCFWSLDGSWGEIKISFDSVFLQVLCGNLHLEKFILPDMSNDKKLIESRFNGEKLNSVKLKNMIELREKIILKTEE